MKENKYIYIYIKEDKNWPLYSERRQNNFGNKDLEQYQNSKKMLPKNVLVCAVQIQFALATKNKKGKAICTS